MSATYRINEVVQRSGFTPATLRYYEEIGLLTGVRRTSAGYRSYDDADLHRLGLIARAKQLGCSLEEIAEMMRAWDGGECGPVQDRLQAAVAARIADAEGAIAHLRTRVEELAAADEALTRHRPDGPCDDRCACVTSGPAPRAQSPQSTRPVPLVGKSGRSGPAPVACTLDPGGLVERLSEWRALLAHATRTAPIDGGRRVELGGAVDLGAVARLAAAEHACCRFMRFALTIDERGLALEVHSEGEGLAVIGALLDDLAG